MADLATMDRTEHSTAADDLAAEDPEPAEEIREASPMSMAGLDDTLLIWARRVKEQQESDEGGTGLPRLPAEPTDVSVERAASLLHQVRTFHRGEPDDTSDLRPPADDLIPALLHPFRNIEDVRNDYPLFLPAETADGERLCVPLADLLVELTRSFAPADEDARIVKDNFTRLERRLRDALSEIDGPVDAAEVIAEAGEAIVAELELPDASAQQVREDLKQLVASVPKDGRLLGLSEYAPLYLFLLAARQRAASRRAALRNEMVRLRHRLRDLLLIDLAKAPEGREPEILSSSIGSIGHDRFDPTILAEVLGPLRGAQPMASERHRRIVGLIKQLEDHLNEEAPPLMTVVYRDVLPPGWKAIEAEWHAVVETNVCSAAATFFDERAARYAKLFAAMRLARLELADAYHAERHDLLLCGFDWEAFSRDELLYLPPILALERAEHAAGDGLIGLSQLLLSGRPVQVLLPIQPALNPGQSLEDDPLMRYRLELAYLGVAHREALVHQSAVSRPEHLMAGFRRSLWSSRACLHVIASGLTSEQRLPRLGPFLHGSAAIEGRAHPLFHYDPGLGVTWASRFDITDNPQSEVDWPLYHLPCVDADGRERQLAIAFTFADFVLMEPRYREHFRVIPPQCTAEEFVTLDDYLARPAREFTDCIAYIWAADADGTLHRVVISRRLAFACRDRLNYWRTLQELAGVRNEHVEAAVHRERDRLQAEFAQQRHDLEEAHAETIEQVRREAAGEAMQRLAETLLDTDLATVRPLGAKRSTPPSGPSAAPAPTTIEAPAAPDEQIAPEPEDDEPQEPWINSVLCTSCNDCIDMNPQLFIYNGSKQAMIGDLRAGTYAQLVQAAEKCPSRCIHPGTPLNPDEPNLEELIRRAKPFR